MKTIFIGGSRHVSRLPSLAKERLNNVIGSGLDVIVGDANGVDKRFKGTWLMQPMKR